MGKEHTDWEWDLKPAGILISSSSSSSRSSSAEDDTQPPREGLLHVESIPKGGWENRNRGRFNLFCLWYLYITSLVRSRSERGGGGEEKKRGEERRGEERRGEERRGEWIPSTFRWRDASCRQPPTRTPHHHALWSWNCITTYILLLWGECEEEKKRMDRRGRWEGGGRREREEKEGKEDYYLVEKP